MTDLYDDARPVRDAAMAEITRLMGQENLSPDAVAANVLGVHLSAVMVTMAANRHKATSGMVADENLALILTGAIATAVSNAATNFRPIHNGKPIPASLNAAMLLEMIATEVFRQVQINEQGLHDFVVPFTRRTDGQMEVKPFDAFEIMKGNR